MPASAPTTDQQRLDRQRWRLLHQIDRWLSGPLAVLGLAWLVLLVIELVRGANPLLERTTLSIWIVFILEFALRFWIAPRKLLYLRRNWLTIIALAIRALRVVRAFRALMVLRAARGVRLLRIVTSLNRGMRTLRRGMSRRGFEYVLALTLLVAFVGAAGMYTFESSPNGRGLEGYGEALWWTAMLMTTIASEFWPQTTEGRILTLLLSVYSIGVFGYVTAALASFFVENASPAQPAAGGAQKSEALRAEIAALRAQLEALQAQLPERPTLPSTPGEP